jgi:hypothetical protein
MNAVELYRRGKLWNHGAVLLALELWLDGNPDWVSAPPSQMRLLYGELRPCETVAGLVKKIGEFGGTKSGSRSCWTRKRDGKSLLSELSALLESSVVDAVTGTDARVKLGNQFLAGEAEKQIRQMQIAQEILDWLSMKHKTEGNQR